MHTSIELPPSAVAVLCVTYDSLLSSRKLAYKDRRKLWKKYKRKKARIINHFATLKLQRDSLLHESDHSDDNEQYSDLPKGPLTNSSIIQYLKSLEPAKNSKVVGILRNPIGILKNITIGTHAVEPDTQVVENQCDSPIDLANEQRISVKKNSGESGDVELNEETSRPVHETDEIARLLAELDDDVEQWQNPLAPSDYQPTVQESEGTVELSKRPNVDIVSSSALDDDRPACSFYLKTGACRFGIRCSKKHESLSSSDTLVFLNMFNTFLFDLEDRLRVSGDMHDLSLEHSEQDLYKEFAEFYFEIEPEFHEIGRISHLYVCKNRCHHLRGNVYVQYLSKNDAKSCYDRMCGRYFGGKPLVCNYVNISSWAGTLCGIDIRTGKCGRGGQCNYLHVFRTPSPKDNAYSHCVNRKGRTHAHRSRYTDRKESRSSLKRKRSTRSPSTHMKAHENGSKIAHRDSSTHTSRKHSHSRSQSIGAGSEKYILSNSQCHKSSVKTVKKRNYASSDDMHSSAESDKSDHNSYRKKKGRKSSKKKKKKHKRKEK